MTAKRNRGTTDNFQCGLANLLPPVVEVNVMPDGLRCGHAQDGSDDIDRRSAATRNTTDLRRARQRARAVMSGVEDDLHDWLERQGVEQRGRKQLNEQRINEAITRLAAARLTSDLVQWLAQRRQRTMARGVRHAKDRLQSTLGDQFRKAGPDFSASERALNRTLSEIDAGLLVGTEAAERGLAEEIGDDITRQIRLGVSNNEPVRSADPEEVDITDRVSMVLNDGDDPRRQSAGITGQTKRTKAELISHDSIQDGYNTAATRRYLQNGFRFVVFDAVCDTRTSQICERLGECSGQPVVIDLLETPWLVPPVHPWCRSGIRPVIDVPRDPVTEEDIADGFLQTVFSTKQFRPTVMDTERELNQRALNQTGEGPGGLA